MSFGIRPFRDLAPMYNRFASEEQSPMPFGIRPFRDTTRQL